MGERRRRRRERERERESVKRSKTVEMTDRIEQSFERVLGSRIREGNASSNPNAVEEASQETLIAAAERVLMSTVSKSKRERKRCR